MNITSASASYPPLGDRISSTGWERTIAAIGAFFIIVLTTHSFQFLFADAVTEGMSTRETARSNPVYLVIFAAQFGIFLLLMTYTTLARGAPRSLLYAGLICIFIALSAWWSVNAKTTLMHAIVFTYLVIAAYVLSTHFKPAEFIRLYFWITAFIVLASFVLLAVVPELTSKTRYGGGWFDEFEFHGVMSSKNLAGYVFASTFIIAVQGSSVGIGWLSRLVFGGLALAAVVLSNSATAVLIVIILAPLSVVLRLSGNYRYVVMFTAFMLFLLAVLLIPFASLGSSFGLLGRDSTFTGRTDLWRLALENIADQPVLGFGYLGFFDTDSFSPAWQFWENFTYFLTDTFHNTAMDITVSLGLVGLALFVAVCLTAGWVVFNTGVHSGARITLALLVAVFVIGGSMEFTIFHHNYVATLVVFYAAFAALRRYDTAAWPVRPHETPDTGKPLLV